MGAARRRSPGIPAAGGRAEGLDREALRVQPASWMPEPRGAGCSPRPTAHRDPVGRAACSELSTPARQEGALSRGEPPCRDHESQRLDIANVEADPKASK